jgi:hypothetical protein
MSLAKISQNLSTNDVHEVNTETISIFSNREHNVNPSRTGILIAATSGRLSGILEVPTFCRIYWKRTQTCDVVTALLVLAQQSDYKVGQSIQ